MGNGTSVIAGVDEGRLGSRPRRKLVDYLQFGIRSVIGSGAEAHVFAHQVGAISAVRVFLIAIGLVTSAMTSRVLGPAGRGLFTTAVVLGTIGSQFGNLGLHSANTYYLGQDCSRLPRIFSNAICIGLGFGGLIALCCWILFGLHPSWAPVQGSVLLGGLLLIPVSLTALLLQNLLLAIREVKWYNVSEITNRAGFVLILALAWLFLRSSVTASQVVFFSLFAGCLTLVVSGTRLVVITHGLLPPSFGLFRLQAGYGLRSYLTCFAGYLVLKSDILLVKYFAGATATGLYSLASSMTDFIYTFPTVVGMILFPLLSGTGTMDARWQRARKTMAGVAVVMSGIALPAGIFATPVVRLVFGARFLPAVPAFLILCVAIVFYGANSVISIFFSSCGQPWFSVWMWFGAALLNVGINVVAIPHLGIVGAALSSLVTYVALFAVQFGFAARFVRRKRGHVICV
jgi:O-antigen/teichoic acid export membrane protein